MIFNKSQHTKAVAYVTALFETFERILIKEYRPKRTIDQNSLYWLWLAILEKDKFEQTGMESEDYHNFFKYEFLNENYKVLTINESSWGFYEFPTTKKLDTKQFADYLGKIERFSNMELQVNLPHPEDKNIHEIFEKYGS